jgi:hypothetical protein
VYSHLAAVAGVKPRRFRPELHDQRLHDVQVPMGRRSVQWGDALRRVSGRRGFSSAGTRLEIIEPAEAGEVAHVARIKDFQLHGALLGGQRPVLARRARARGRDTDWRGRHRLAV